jgi:hypothetical protein
MTADDILIRRSEYPTRGLGDSALYRARRSGEFTRVVTGAYADTQAWAKLWPIEQHRIRVLATAERLKTPVVFSHYAAAALWGIRMLGAWPDVVDVTLERATGGRSDGGVRRHCTGLDAVDIVNLDGMAVTSPAETVVNLARRLPFADGVVAMDSALNRKRKPHPLTSMDAINEVVARIEGRRGYRKARAAAAFATALSDSPEESHSRVQIHLGGFPAPVLQHPFALRDGSIAEVDFFWPEYQHVGECDGRSKYTDPEFLRGRTSQQAFFDEKNRENEIRRQVKQFSRWEPRELYTPGRLHDRLVRDGLPSGKRRP